MTQENLELKAATPRDWHDLLEMPAKSVHIDLEPHFYDPEDVVRMKRGFIPKEMEQKWFIYCTDEYIYFHRSWTGNLIYKVYIYEGDDGEWVLTSADVNRDPEQYGGTDNAEDERIIFELIDYYLVQDHAEYQSGLETSLELALKPNYLGNPEVVSNALMPFFEAVYKKLQANFDDGSMAVTSKQVNDEIHQICEIFRGSHPGYNPVGSWNSEKELGQVIIKCFNLDPDYYADENMYCILSEGFAGVALAAKQSIGSGKTHGNIESIQQLLLQIHQFTTSVLLGTHTVTHPKITLKSLLA
ncbi:MAG: hypothetical protein HOO85_09650 [Methylotenera sp.]|nr:hypothetical protein [Methylotenera sp.]